MKDLSIKKLYYSISEVSKITDIEQYVLRYWETECPQLSPSKSKSGQRVYSREDLDIILNIKNLLYEQLNAPVMWEETIRNMVNDGIEEFYEIGPGKVLQGLIKRINPDIKSYGIEKYPDMEKYL